MARKKSRNPFGLSTFSCALAGVGLYLLYRKFKGLSDPPDDGYALSIPAPLVPSEAPASQARAMAARQPSRAVRSRVAQAYAPIQREPTTEDRVFEQINAIAKDLSDKALMRPTVSKTNYPVYDPSQPNTVSAAPVGASKTPKPTERPTSGGPAATISESSKKEYEVALRIQDYWDKKKEQIAEGAEKGKEESGKLISKAEDPSLPEDEKQKLLKAALVVGDQFSLFVISYTEDIRDKFREAFPRGINTIETQKVRDWAIKGTGELTELRMEYEANLSQGAKDWLIKARRNEGIPVLTSF